ncbi:MAG: phospholipid carrier-dependent glycosyltransferase [Actinomycetota bacterium]|nr:phospholipid carrier-dependent glycosyltransferase [Actinomycetota bacterium]
MRLRKLAVDHWFLLIVLTAGTVLRIVVTLAYEPILMLQRDTYTYLHLAVETGVSGFRPSLYPLMLKPLLATGGLELVALVQHLSGLSVAVLLYLLMRKLGVSAPVAALGVAPPLLDGFVLNIEHYLLTETFFILFLVGALVLLSWSDRPSWLVAGTGGVLIGLSTLLRFVGAAAIVPALVYVLVRRMGWMRVVALGAGFLIPLGAYSLWFSSETGSGGLTDSSGFFLYGRVVEFADCDEVEVESELREYCPEESIESESIESETKGMFTSGLDIKAVREDPEGNSKLLRFGRAMIVAKPGAYLGEVLSDFVQYFEASEPESREPNVKRWLFVTSVAQAEPHPTVLRFDAGPPPTSGIDADFKINEGSAGFLRSYQGVFYTYGPLLAIMLVVGLVGGALARRPEEGRWLLPDTLLFTLVAIALLLAPTMLAVYHFRYVLPAISLGGTAAALGFTALVKRFGRT